MTRRSSRARELARAALANLEANRSRIDDLNVYPVPDGDTGTNLTLTVRAIVEALEASTAHRPGRGREGAHARGADGRARQLRRHLLPDRARRRRGARRGRRARRASVARAFRSASDAAYRAVRRPVEGTMLTVIRELAEEAERPAPRAARRARASCGRSCAAARRPLARTPEQLAVLREAGVVDAGGAGLLEIVRGLAAALAGEPLPDAPVERARGRRRRASTRSSRVTATAPSSSSRARSSTPTRSRTSSSRSATRCSSSATRPR